MFQDNQVLAARLNTTFLHQKDFPGTALADCRILLRESTLNPTQYKEFVTGWQDFVGIMDMSGECVRGGMIVGKNIECVPIVYIME